MYSHNPSNDTPPGTRWNAYKVAAVITGSTAFLGAGAVILPHSAGAYWPFAKAQAAEETAPVLHDSTLELLQAAVNPDPNPSKGGPDVALSDGSALIPGIGPVGSLPPGAALSDIAVGGGGDISVYVVKEGDNLSQIASSHGISVNTILWANNIKDPSTIKPGTELVILPVSGVRHKVTSGETVASIAKKFSADADDIAFFNGITADGALKVGDELIIPGGELPKTSTSAKKTAIKQGGSLSSVKSSSSKSSAGAGYYTHPVPGSRVTQGIHGSNAVDLGAPKGTPVYAAAAGTVIVSRVGGWNGGYGNYVVISHGNGTQTLYSHLATDSVSVGEKVSKGQKIGTVGMTGQATGYHLHFEIRGATNPFD